MRLSKKAQLETLKALVGLILVIIIGFVMYNFISDVIANFIEQKNPTVRDFRLLKQEIDALLSSPSPFAATKLPITLQEKYVIVGYDYDYEPDDITRNYAAGSTTWSAEAEGDGKTKYYKPSGCEVGACLCLFKNMPDWDEDDRDDDKVECLQIPGKVYISSYEYGKEFVQNLGSKRKNCPVASALKGMTSDWYARLVFPGRTYYTDQGAVPSWGVKSLYIEKVVLNGISYILLLPEDSNSANEIKDRYKILDYRIGGSAEAAARQSIAQLAGRVSEDDNNYVRIYQECEMFRKTFADKPVPSECSVRACGVDAMTCKVINPPCICSKTSAGSDEQSLCKESMFCSSDAGCTATEPAMCTFMYADI